MENNLKNNCKKIFNIVKKVFILHTQSQKRKNNLTIWHITNQLKKEFDKPKLED
jgi:hypothetical protein